MDSTNRDAAAPAPHLDAAAKTSSAPRLAAPDNVRGLIMAIMAIDHASAFIAHRHSGEWWRGGWTRYTSAVLFLTRFVTHLCAPGFFFLMGLGMYLFASSRRAQGWSPPRIIQYFVKRGALLILLNVLVEIWLWKLGTAFQHHAGEPHERGLRDIVFPIMLTVLSGLGMSMIAGALLLQTGRLVGPISFALLLICNALIPSPEQAAASYPVWAQLLLLPGGNQTLWVLYPLLPWLGVCGLGIALGRLLAAGGDTAARTWRALPFVGLLAIGLALLDRYGGGFGNIRAARDSSWIEFLNFIKYPPALTFVLFMLGVNTILLSLLQRPLPVLRVFGQAPLCFYFAHLLLYGGIGALFFQEPSSLLGMYAVWLVGLVPLYFICQRYRRFKESKSADSLWRLF